MVIIWITFYQLWRSCSFKIWRTLMCNLRCTCISDHMWAHMVSNVISIMSSTTILVGLKNGLTCMFKVFINVCCAFGFEMMIKINGVFKLLGITFWWNPLITWACVDLRLLEHVHLGGGGALDTWTKLSNICMFTFALQLSYAWTHQIVDQTTILKMECHHHWGSQRGHVGLHLHLTIGSLPYDLFSPSFSSTSNIKFLDNIFFLYHGMGLAPSCSCKSLVLVYTYTKSYAQFGKFGPLHSFHSIT